MFNRSYCDRKSQLSGILTEPLNPRGFHIHDSMILSFFVKSFNKHLKTSFKAEDLILSWDFHNI